MLRLVTRDRDAHHILYFSATSDIWILRAFAAARFAQRVHSISIVYCLRTGGDIGSNMLTALLHHVTFRSRD